MRRLRRAHQGRARRDADRRGKFKCYAVAAGTAAALALAAGPRKCAIAADPPDPHQLPVAQDADADLLSNAEELAIGYQPFDPDQNANAVPDGAELARRCAAVVAELPSYPLSPTPPDTNETYKMAYALNGLEQCDVCGEWIHMGGWAIINPKLGLCYPDPNDPMNGVFLPDLALHYMGHGSFDCYGSIHQGRVDIARLLRVLELRFPYDPNEHQLPLDYIGPWDGRPIARDANDIDGDLLGDSEELEAGYNLYDPDQDNDLTPDGIELAKLCAVAIRQLPIFPSFAPPEIQEPYVIFGTADGQETCGVCGRTIGMGAYGIVNPRLGLTYWVLFLQMHYMEHGSFTCAKVYNPDLPQPYYGARVDIPLLVKVLEMPRHCGDLGTLYLPSDLNEDCKTNSADFGKFADGWLESTDPNHGK